MSSSPPMRRSLRRSVALLGGCIVIGMFCLWKEEGLFGFLDVTSNTTKTSMIAKSPSPLSKQSVAICAIQKNGLRYLDEWVDYHLALGFNHIYLYDNSDSFETKEWATRRKQQQPNNDALDTIPYPGSIRQLEAYAECMKHIQGQDPLYNNSRVVGEDSTPSSNTIFRYYEWIAFFDIDEFVVLKQHATIGEMLDQTLTQATNALNGTDNIIVAGISLNRYWYFFWDNQLQVQETYQPSPVTKRFPRRVHLVDAQVKTIARTRFVVQPRIHQHFYRYSVHEKYLPVDTTGSLIVVNLENPQLHPNGPTNVAVIHHYATKSVEEYQSKCTRGDAVFGNTSLAGEGKAVAASACSTRDEIVDRFSAWTEREGGTVRDEQAWKLLQQNVPRYREERK